MAKVRVKIFGVFRLDSGIKEMTVQVETVKELFPLIIEEAKRLNPQTPLKVKDLEGCVVAVNGKQVKPNTKLQDGDEVMLVPAVAGG